MGTMKGGTSRGKCIVFAFTHLVEASKGFISFYAPTPRVRNKLQLQAEARAWFMGIIRFPLPSVGEKDDGDNGTTEHEDEDQDDDDTAQLLHGFGGTIMKSARSDARFGFGLDQGWAHGVMECWCCTKHPIRTKGSPRKLLGSQCIVTMACVCRDKTLA